MADQTYFSEWQPENPSALKLAGALRGARDFANKATIPSWMPFVGGKGLGDVVLPDESSERGIERIGWGDPLTTGSGFATQMHPDVSSLAVSLASLVNPPSKGAGLASGVAQAGLREAGSAGGAAAERAMLKDAIGTMKVPKGKPAPDPADFLARPTVTDPQRVSYPGIYKRPDALVAGAKVAKEDPLLQQLFGVDRFDLYDIAQGGTRAGNFVERPFEAPANPRGSAAAYAVMNPRNDQRLLDIMEEASKRPDLYQGMTSWYTMDPLYDHFKRLYGADRAPQEYARFNTLTGMASPGSEVLTELNRGTAANWLDKQGRLADFMRYGGVSKAKRGEDFPQDMQSVLGHAYHSTAQAPQMETFLQSGAMDMGSAKVPSYISASGVPETGFQTQWPVGDAHWSRLVGLPDVRTASSAATRNASASVPEMTTLGPWWKGLANQAGLQSVPAQALVWGAGSNATGVTSPIGAGKLELLARQIGKAARRLGISPEEARDRVILGQTHAGLTGTGGTAGQLANAAGDVPAQLRQWLNSFQPQQPQPSQ